MRIPIKIDPCPIVEAIVEIRFDRKHSIDSDAIFGIVYQSFISDYPTLEKSPILQLPEAMRSNDPNLASQAYYSFSNDDFLIQLGPKVFSIHAPSASNPKEYIGWAKFEEEILRTFSTLYKLNVIEKITRLGIRYVNFFQGEDILDKLNLDIKLNDEKLYSLNTSLTANIASDNFINRLQIANMATLTNKKQETRIGSIIDIDTHTENDLEKFFDNLSAILNDGHYCEKKLFFSLLKDKFLKSLNPKYE